MQFGASGEIIFGSRTEARVVADLLVGADRTDLLENIEPPVEPPSIGRWELARKATLERKGQIDPGVYTVSGDDVVQDMLQTLMRASNLTVNTKKPITKPDYMGSKILEFKNQVEAIRAEAQAVSSLSGMRVVKIGQTAIFGNISTEEEDFLKKRQAFAESYMAERGWELSSLSIDQLLEIRSQPGWQDPE